LCCSHFFRFINKEIRRIIMRTIKFLLAILFSLTVAACNSGGGSSSGGSTPTAAVQISGEAAKGIIKFATVTAYELNATGSSVRTVGTSETDASGKYSLNVASSAGYTGGPLKLVLSAKSDGSTKMACDVSAGCGAGVAFGQDYVLPLTFTLVAYQQSASNGATVTAQITPYTSMAAARIQAQIQVGSTLDNTLVANATSEVSQMVGVDVSKTEPVDITNPTAVAAAGPDALQYAAFNAGIGNVAFASGNFEAGITAAANSFADGKFDSTDAVSIASIVAAVNTEALGTPALNTTTLTATLASITTNTTVAGVYDPAPSSTATLTAVAQAKGLVSQTRTWGNQIAALKTPADAAAVSVTTAKAVLNSTSNGLAGWFFHNAAYAIKTVKTQAMSAGGLQATSYSFPISYWDAQNNPVSGTGTVTVASNSSGNLMLTISAPAIAGVTTSGTVTTPLLSSSILGTQQTSVALASGLSTLSVTGSASTSSPATSFTVKNGTLNMTLSSLVNSSTATKADLVNISSMSFNGDVTLAANGVTFEGTGSINLVANNVANDFAPISVQKISVSGTFTDSSNNSANASATVTFNNAATFDVIGLLNSQPMVGTNYNVQSDQFGLSTIYSTANSGDTLNQFNYDGSQTCVWGNSLNTGGTCVPGDPYGVVAAATTAVTANYNNQKAPPNASYIMPAPTATQNVFVFYCGGIFCSSPNTFYGATLTFPDFESASFFANVTITVSSGITLTGSPAATLTATANRTGYGTSANPVVGDVSAVLNFSGQSLTFAASNTAATPTSGTATLTISNPAGVHLVLSGTGTSGSTSGTLSGTLSVGATQVGTVSSSSGTPLIYYNDGTFESLR
jgi:hypothetical protein